MRTTLLALLFTLSLQASHVNWQSNFDKAHQRALQEHKNLLVLLIEKDASNSTELLRSTFMNQPYINTIKSQFIAILVIKGQKESYPIEMLYTFTYPSLFFLNSQELFIHDPIRGNINPKSIKSALKEINNTHK
jgi:hypothetical protein